MPVSISFEQKKYYAFSYIIALIILFRNRGFPARMVYHYYISCLRCTILVGNPRNESERPFFLPSYLMIKSIFPYTCSSAL